MGALIAAVTSLGGTAIALATKIGGAAVTVVGGWLAAIGVKLLSFKWIKVVYETIEKIVGVLKNTIFNRRMVRVFKFLLTTALFGMTVYQIALLVKTMLRYIPFADQPLPLVIIYACAVVACAVFCISFLIILLLKKRAGFGFVSAMAFTYFFTLFFSAFFGGQLYADLMQSFELLKLPFVLCLLLLAFFKLVNADHPTSALAFFLSAFGVFLAYRLFIDDAFGAFVIYENGEVALASNKLGLMPLFERFISFFTGGESGLSGIESDVFNFGLSYVGSRGNIVAAIALTVNLALIVIGQLLPFVIAAASIAMLLGMQNDRAQQYDYLTKSIRILFYAFWSTAVGWVLALCDLWFFASADSVAVTVNTRAILFTLGGILGLIVICAVSRKWITDKLANKYKKYLR